MPRVYKFSVNDDGREIISRAGLRKDPLFKIVRFIGFDHCTVAVFSDVRGRRFHHETGQNQFRRFGRQRNDQEDHERRENTGRGEQHQQELNGFR